MLRVYPTDQDIPKLCLWIRSEAAHIRALHRGPPLPFRAGTGMPCVRWHRSWMGQSLLAACWQ